MGIRAWGGGADSGSGFDADNLQLGLQGSVEPTISLASLDPAGTRWRVVCASGLFHGVVDHVCRWGWNVGGAGGRENQSAHALFVQLESGYFNGASTLAEWIVGWLSADGTISRRPVQAGVDIATGACSTSVEGQFAIFDSARAHPARLNVVDTSAAVTRAYFDHAILTIQPTDTPALTQLNAAGSAYTELLRLNNLGYVQLAGAGGMTQTRGGLVVQSSIGQSWTNSTFSRGLMLMEANTTRWNLVTTGTTTTLESGASITITGGRDLAFSASSGATPDCVTSRHSVSLPANTALSLLAITLAANASVAFEFDLACKSTTGSSWGHFRKACTIVRVGSAAPVIGAQSTIYMLRSASNFEPFFDVGATYGQVIATSNALAPTLAWTGTITRIVQP